MWIRPIVAKASRPVRAFRVRRGQFRSSRSNSWSKTFAHGALRFFAGRHVANLDISADMTVDWVALEGVAISQISCGFLVEIDRF
jgi:hypothetical protein